MRMRRMSCYKAIRQMRPWARPYFHTIPQSPLAKFEIGVAGHLHLQFLYLEVVPDLEDRNHPAPQENRKSIRMHIFI